MYEVKTMNENHTIPKPESKINLESKIPRQKTSRIMVLLLSIGIFCALLSTGAAAIYSTAFQENGFANYISYHELPVQDAFHEDEYYAMDEIEYEMVYNRQNIVSPDLEFVPTSGAMTIKPNGEDRTLCIDIGSIANEQGSVLLNDSFWDMGMTDPEGRQAIVICGYEYHNISTIYFNMSNTYVYCNDGAVINGKGVNNGFLSYSTLSNTSLRNCHIKNFYRGMNFMGCGCGIYDNKVENAQVGIKGCICDSHIKGNDVRDLYGQYARGIEQFNLAGIDDYYALIEDNYIENGRIGIYGIHTVHIRNNRIHNGTDAGIQVEYSSLVENNVVTDSRWGIYARIDNNRSVNGVTVKNNRVEYASRYGIYLLYINGFNPSTPFQPELTYAVKDNTVIGAGWNGIYLNGNNFGFNYTNSVISGNRITKVNPEYPDSPYYGMSLRRQTNGITVKDNIITQRPYALECSYSQEINWSCNSCRGGLVNNFQDSCVPEPFCESCYGGSPIFKKMLYDMAPRG